MTEIDLAMTQTMSGKPYQTLFNQWFVEQQGLSNSELFTGPLYPMKLRTIEGHQFFLSPQWKNGSLKISGLRYDNVQMVFDIQKNLLVLKHPAIHRTDGIQLNMEHVTTFNIEDHKFKMVEANSQSGFYEYVYEGKHLNLLIKRKKVEVAEREGTVFKSKDEIYILKAEKLFKLRNRKSLILVFPEHAASIKQIPKQYDVRFKIRNEIELIRFIIIFDSMI